MVGKVKATGQCLVKKDRMLQCQSPDSAGLYMQLSTPAEAPIAARYHVLSALRLFITSTCRKCDGNFTVSCPLV